MFQSKECCRDSVSSDVLNEGNFRELLRFRVSAGDELLKGHLETAGANATYISKTTQNALIASIGKTITEIIENKINKSQFFSVMFDETTDAAHVEQMSVSVRYVDTDANRPNSSIREDFIEFVDLLAHMKESGLTENSELRLTGEAIGKTVIAMMKKHNLDTDKCVGIGTDGCSVMTSEARGAAAEVAKTALHAVHCICANHSLNLCLSKTSSIQAVRNAMGITQQICRFFNASAKRHNELTSILKANSTTRRSTLTGFCETRWVERHDCVLQFCSSFADIFQALSTISNWQDAETSSKARTLMSAMKDSEFVTACYSLADVFAVTLPLSQALQAEGIDQTVALENANTVINALKMKRAEADDVFASVFEEICNAADDIGTDIAMPRIAKRQIHRTNTEASNPEEYFRRTVYIPMLDAIINDMISRFGKQHKVAVGLSLLVPKQSVQCADFKPLEDSARFYNNIISDYSTDVTLKLLKAEVTKWRLQWQTSLAKNKVAPPVTAIDGFSHCDGDFFPLSRNYCRYCARFQYLLLQLSVPFRRYVDLRPGPALPWARNDSPD